MNNIYRTNFEQVKEVYKDIFDALERAFKKLDVDFYLIGAQSRDVWINHLSLEKRTTRDIDYAVYVADLNTWQVLTTYLVQEEGFTRDEKEPYRFYYGETVDLIPFGGIEENDQVVLQNPTTELSVYGCREVTEEAVMIEGTFKVITLPGLCIMKLVAFDEKPGQRAKDLDDFLFILENYAEIGVEELFYGAYEDLIDGDFELHLAAARMLGRHIARIVNKSPKLKLRIIIILQNRLQMFTEEEINQMYKVRDEGDEQIFRLKLITEVVKGIKD
jgi:predicted nucleotidyltransferase